jgi:predicted CXXCH cytochrome family protein
MEELCYTCHDAHEGKKNQHPALEEGCTTCHDPHQSDMGALLATDSMEELCYTCHDEHGEKENQHPALEEGCTTCHDPHQSDTNRLLEADSMAELCFTCHDEAIRESEWKHSPVEMGGCELCHNPHESDHRSLLVESPTNLCLLCHAEIDTAFRSGKSLHMSAREDCTSCHNPHSSEKQHLVKEATPELCFKCHGDIKDRIASSRINHKVITEGDNCLGCHVPHASGHDGLLKEVAASLCGECHNAPIERSSGTIRGIIEEIANREYVHPPVDDGDCGACHNPHGSTTHRLLRDPFPESAFAPYTEETYALCFACHDQDVLRYRQTTTRTRFRNGDDNLHFYHVTETSNRCTSCHYVHASSRENLIREKSLFGREEVPLNFERTDTGGSCNPGCHDTLSYDRDNPVKKE